MFGLSGVLCLEVERGVIREACWMGGCWDWWGRVALKIMPS